MMRALRGSNDLVSVYSTMIDWMGGDSDWPARNRRVLLGIFDQGER